MTRLRVKWFRRFSFTSLSKLELKLCWGFFFSPPSSSIFLSLLISLARSLLSTHSQQLRSAASLFAINWNSWSEADNVSKKFFSPFFSGALLRAPLSLSLLWAIEFHFLDDSSPHLIVYIIPLLRSSLALLLLDQAVLLRPKLEKREAARWRGEEEEE